jgi:hypothetical protein
MDSKNPLISLMMKPLTLGIAFGIGYFLAVIIIKHPINK